MTSVFRVELRRLVARRLFRALTMLAAAAFALAGAMAFIGADDSPDRVAAAAEQRRVDIAQCVDAVRSGDDEFPPEADTNPQAFCEGEVWVEDPRFDYSEMTWILGSLVMPLMALAWLVGASAIGAEWASRSMTLSLTWESRRGRLLAAKIGAVAVVTLLWALALEALFSLAMFPAAALEGTFAAVDAQWIEEYVSLALRGAVVCAGAAAIGAGAAIIGRNTAAAFGAGFAYFAVVESLVRRFRPSWIEWLAGDNLALVLIGPQDVTHIGHSQAGAALVLLGYVALVCAGAAFVFRRREVA